MRSPIVAAGCMLAVLLTGCSQSDVQDAPSSPSMQEIQSTPDAENTPDQQPEGETPVNTAATPLSGRVYYITDHDTVALSDVSSFTDELTEKGCTLETGALADVPIDMDAVIFNTPREDITDDELKILDSYMDEGGHVMLLMPPDEREMRYNTLELFLESYCILMDYDMLSETLPMNMVEGDAHFLHIEPVGVPNGMDSPADAAVFQHDVRSFHFLSGNHFTDAIKQDAMLETYDTAIGTPCGGMEDDPLTYEGERLVTMLYSRNDQRRNSTVIAVGSSDFLLNENYAEPTSSQMKEWVFQSVNWFTSFLH